jgi:hypothetical protein
MLAGCLFLSVGCARRPYVPSLQVPKRVLVMDLDINEALALRPQDRQGWWFGSRDVYYDANIGRNLADELAVILGDLPYVDLAPRAEYRAFAQSRRPALEKAFPSELLTAADYDRMVARANPVAVGRQLGADVVISGRVETAHYAQNRTIWWTWSSLEYRLDIHDVRTGALIGSLSSKDTDQIKSVLRMGRQNLRAQLPEIDRLMSSAGRTTAAPAETLAADAATAAGDGAAIAP